MLPDAAFLLPNAPLLPAIKPSALLNAFVGRRSWFSLIDNTDQGLARAATPAVFQLNNTIDAELSRLSLSGEKVSLVGFSQGGMMAFGAGLQRKTPPRAIAAIASRLLTLPINLDNSSRTSIMIAHGGKDMVVAMSHGTRAAAHLSEIGYEVTTFFEADTGHDLTHGFLTTVGEHLRNSARSAPKHAVTVGQIPEHCAAA